MVEHLSPMQASHQCGPGSIPGLGVKCRLSLLLVLVLAPRERRPCPTVFSSSIPRKQRRRRDQFNILLRPSSIPLSDGPPRRFFRFLESTCCQIRLGISLMRTKWRLVVRVSKNLWTKWKLCWNEKSRGRGKKEK